MKRGALRYLLDNFFHLTDITHILSSERKQIDAQAMEDGEYGIDIKIPWAAAAVENQHPVFRT
ncbi:MAG: hypothetical protein ACYC7J_08875 [Syntrophales bacterium]